MKWKSPRNGGNNNNTRARQGRQSRERAGQGRWGLAGHHSWAKGHGGGNKIGAITSPLGEWSSKGRKEEEHNSFAAKQAELDAIAEGLGDAHDAVDEANAAEWALTENEWDDLMDREMYEVGRGEAYANYLDEMYGDMYAGTDTTEGDI